MVLLTVTPAIRAAVTRYSKLQQLQGSTANETGSDLGDWLEAEIGSPIEHSKLIEISALLVREDRQSDENCLGKEWRLDTLLKGANIYRAPPSPKPEPVSTLKC